jgi:predicted glutamine amidotransferase
MCELLALSSLRPARLTNSLRTLAARGSAAHGSRDGWGAAFYEGQDVALFREPAAAADSPLVRHLQSQGPAASLAILHIRHATRGDLSLANTQPFVRELGGRKHVFAHNGDLPDIFHSEAFNPAPYRSVGQTDSEHAFCALLARLRPLWKASGSPSYEARLSVLTTFAAELRTLGPANFIYSDGDALFAHGHRRIQPASGNVESPGLWWLQRECHESATDAGPVAGAPAGRRAQSVLLFASVPLGSEPWQPLSEGELLAARRGRRLAPIERRH